MSMTFDSKLGHHLLYGADSANIVVPAKILDSATDVRDMRTA